MLCSTCGTDNDAGRRFCDTCGAPLSVACRMCGSSNRPTARFCGDCGTPVEGPGAGGIVAPRPVAVETAGAQAERRLVSVLFVDLVGYTTLADGWDPEQARDLLTALLRARRGTSSPGTAAPSRSSSATPSWRSGAPRPPTRTTPNGPSGPPSSSSTASRASEPSLQARAGVLTGEAAVTVGATNQGIVAGDLVNTASRLQSVAPPGTVLVGEATERTAIQGDRLRSPLASRS